tara:strand:- start:1085 stop:1273 length:189 start_codon:yes stop_codon:yes gene_type:complete
MSKFVEFSGGKFYIQDEHVNEFHELETIYLDFDDLYNDEGEIWESAYDRMWEIVKMGIDVSS